MNEIEQYAEMLRRAFEGESWQGDSLSELLDGVTAEQALARPLHQAHTIWEIVLHIRVWHGVVRRRINGEAVHPTDADSFPPTGRSAGEWKEAIDDLRKSSAETVAAIRSFAVARLDDKVPGKDYVYRHLLSGVSTHDAYHAGQIGLLKKALKGSG
jgi:Uncharacterized protein conserved in bacteria